MKARILDWQARAIASGELHEVDAAKLLGIKTWRIATWRREAARAKPAPLALVRVEAPAMNVSTQISLVTPAGYRVEGLGLEQVVMLLREFA